MRLLIVLTAVAAVSSQALAADPATLCNRLAAQARTVKDSGWRMGAEAALRPALQINKLNAKPPPFEASLAELPAIKEGIGAEDGAWTIFTDHLHGTDIYSASTVQGTLHCQTSSFIKADKVNEPKIIGAPAVMGEGEGPCWTQSGEFGQLYGQAAFFEHGTINDHSFDTTISVTPWIGETWAQGCELDLKFLSHHRLVERHCDDQAFCRSAETTAKALAQAYNAYRAIIKNNDPFRFGPTPPASVATIAERWVQKNGQMMTPDFPMFGATTEYGGVYGLSYSGFQMMPINIRGEWLIAAVGHEGVGWRESGRTLLAIYVEQSGTLKPRAGFVFDMVNGGLIQASVKTLPPPPR